MRTWHEIRRFPLAVRLPLVNQLGVDTGFHLLIPYLATHLTEDLGMSAVAGGGVVPVVVITSHLRRRTLRRRARSRSGVMARRR